MHISFNTIKLMSIYVRVTEFHYVNFRKVMLFKQLEDFINRIKLLCFLQLVKKSVIPAIC